MLFRSGVEVKTRDVLLVRTGFATRRNEEEAYLNAAGVSKSGNMWAADRQVQAVGADNMVWDCMFVGIPLKLRGATGSPIRPLALVG